MISHLIPSRLADALKLTDSRLDKIALGLIKKPVLTYPMLIEFRIYMAHPIIGMDDDALVQLNEDYQKLARGLAKLELTGSEIIPRLIDPTEIEVGFDQTMTTNPIDLVQGDLDMISTCDTLVYDFRAGNYSAGACMELFYAYRNLGIKTIVVTDRGVSPNSLSPWIKAHATYITSDFNRVKDLCNKIIADRFSFEKNPVLVEKHERREILSDGVLAPPKKP